MRLEPLYNPVVQGINQGQLLDELSQLREARQAKIQKLQKEATLKEVEERNRLHNAILDFQRLADLHIREILKHIEDTKLRRLSDEFRVYINDLLIQQPQEMARNDPTVRAAYYLGVPASFTRGIDINI